jgi:hypothetical protein
MAVRGDVLRRPPRAPLQPRSRKRWAVVAGVAGLWLLFVLNSGSVLAGTVLLLLLAAGAAGFVAALRCLGVSTAHPWVQRLATRPWRDGRDVLQLGLRHLPEVFVVTPSGSLLAPNLVELLMSPDDFASLAEIMDLALIDSSATEVYESVIAAHSAVLARVGRAEVCVIGDPAVPAGRYRLRQGRLAGPAAPGPAAPGPAAPGPAESAPDRPHFAGPFPAGPAAAWPPSAWPPSAGPPPAWPPPAGPPPAGPPPAGPPPAGPPPARLAAVRTLVTDRVTVAAPVAVPLLRLVTNGSVTQTRISGACAGRGAEAELALPEEPTVSRVHAKFSFCDGEWWITSLGRNGVMLNGSPLAGQHPIENGDSIRWGLHRDALVSRAEIG